VAPGDDGVVEVEKVVVVCVGARWSRKREVEGRLLLSVLNRRVALGRNEIEEGAERLSHNGPISGAAGMAHGCGRVGRGRPPLRTAADEIRAARR